MSLFNKSFKDRLADQAKAKDKLAKSLSETSGRPIKEKKIAVKIKDLINAPAPKLRVERPWAGVRVERTLSEYKARATNEKISPQPWTIGLIDTLLESADVGSVTLCFVWPAKLSSVSLLHGLANIERVFVKDLRGMRSLLYPATHTSRATLQSVLADRARLCTFYLSLWKKQETGTELNAQTMSPSFQAALSALNDIRLKHSELPDPSLGELIPHFMFDLTKKIWSTTITNPIERTLCKVEHLSNRRDLRQKIGEEWRVLEKAPGALLTLHHTTKKESWRTALNVPALKGLGCPESLLLDATSAAIKTNYDAVKRIPDFLIFARENGLVDSGATIITDDPKAFFDLSARLGKLKVSFNVKVWAAEADDIFLSSNPVDFHWKPKLRSNSNFNISIIDRDASHISLMFQRLAISLKNEEILGYRALMNACLYILRLSNIPAGYSDLTAASTEAGDFDFCNQLNAWTPVKAALSAALASGELNSVRSEVEKAVCRAEKLIDDWNDATPMALRLLAEVKKQVITNRSRVSIVLPNKKYLLLANCFLKRKLAAEWSFVDAGLAWHTLSSVAKTLSEESRDHLVFVGMNPDVLRILVTHLNIPHGTVILVAYRQAESSLNILTRMKEFDAFKSYRGRIGLMMQELGRRLKEVPNPINIEKLQEVSMTFKFDDIKKHHPNSEQASYKVELEGKGFIYISGWVYRYVPDEDPPFRRAAASAIIPGDFIFDMSDDIRAELESSLHLSGDNINSIVDPARMLLKLYHADVQTRCSLMFKATKRSALAREIHAKMIQIDSTIADCRVGRVYYWLALQLDGDTRPHAPRDTKFFKVFCKALGISDEGAEQHWIFIRNARHVNQSVGRELVARYAEILFQPESAKIYRKIPQEIIDKLQQEALRCVYRVENIVPPIRG